jgi:hypothetical protein
MELAEAIQQSLPLQILIPSPRRPLQTEPHLVAEMFVVDTSSGRAIVWLEPFWCEGSDLQVCRIGYASPRSAHAGRRWTDEQPRYGPRCLAYQKPFVIERVDQDSLVWAEWKAWHDWRAKKGLKCDRDAAWRRVETELRDLNLRRLV